jgi:hypothetical protein
MGGMPVVKDRLTATANNAVRRADQTLRQTTDGRPTITSRAGHLTMECDSANQQDGVSEVTEVIPVPFARLMVRILLLAGAAAPPSHNRPPGAFRCPTSERTPR